MNEIPKAHIDKYIVARWLYKSPKTIRELKDCTGIPPNYLLNAIGNHIKNARIKINKLGVEKVSKNGISQMATVNQYELTEKGHYFLARMEYKHRMYEQEYAPSQISDTAYLEEIRDICVKYNWFGHPPTVS